MSRREILYLGIAAFLFLSFGCVSETETGGTTIQTPSDGVTDLLSGSNQIEIGETATSGSLSFIVDAWGFAPIWGDSEPPEGAKFIWMYINVTNVGDVPIEHLPHEFKVEYRGTSASPREARKDAYDLPSKTAYGMMWSKKDYYPGTSNAGYILFEVPQNLESGEATLIAPIDGTDFSVKLESPVSYEGIHIVIKNARFECSEVGSVMQPVYCCRLVIDILNDKYVPVGSSRLGSIRNAYPLEVYVNGIKPEQSTCGVMHGSSTDFWVENLGPFEETTMELPVTIYCWRYPSGEGHTYSINKLIEEEQDGVVHVSVGSMVLGEPGAKVSVTFCNESCTPDSMELTLPPLPEDYME